MVLHLSSWKGYRETILISFGFPFSRRSLSYKCTFADCDVCYLFYGKNLASPYKCRKVELICSACVKRKRFVPVMGTTWMLPGHLKQIYIRLAVM